MEIKTSTESLARPNTATEQVTCLPSLVPMSSEQMKLVSELLEKAAETRERENKYARESNEQRKQFTARKDATLRDLLPESDVEGHSRLGHNEIDNVIREALGANGNGEMDSLLIAACAAYRRCPDYSYQSWSHAVCHNFEHHVPGKPESSLLGRPSLLPATEGLLEEAANRAAKHGVGCFDRTMGGVISFALSQVRLDSMDQPFPWKPACLSNPQLIERLGKDKPTGIFCDSKTPREFLERIIALVASTKEKVYGVDFPLDLIEAVRTENNQEAVDIYLRKTLKIYEHTEAIPGLLSKRRSALSASDTVPGLFVDVDGTLITRDWHGNSPTLSRAAKLVGTLSQGARTPIVIFTGGNPSEATELLKSPMLPE